jgi:hypothetical protein
MVIRSDSRTTCRFLFAGRRQLLACSAKQRLDVPPASASGYPCGCEIRPKKIIQKQSPRVSPSPARMEGQIVLTQDRFGEANIRQSEPRWEWLRHVEAFQKAA